MESNGGTLFVVTELAYLNWDPENGGSEGICQRAGWVPEMRKLVRWRAGRHVWDLRLSLRWAELRWTQGVELAEDPRWSKILQRRGKKKKKELSHCDKDYKDTGQSHFTTIVDVQPGREAQPQLVLKYTASWWIMFCRCGRVSLGKQLRLEVEAGKKPP